MEYGSVLLHEYVCVCVDGELTAPLQRSLISSFGVRRMTDILLRVLDGHGREL